MKFARFGLVSLTFALAARASYGQQPFHQLAVAGQPAITMSATDCPHVFSIGKASSNTFFQYCVNDRGNITQVEAPLAHFHIGVQGEGYGFCQQDPTPGTAYYDYLNFDSGNWQAPQILSASSSSIKISRTTADGNWTLVQTISKVALTHSIKLVMALTNNQPLAKVAYIARFVDVNPDGQQTHNAASGAAIQSAFAWNEDAGVPVHYGLQLGNIGKWSGFQQAYLQGIPNPPNPCAFAGNAERSPFLEGVDTSLVYAYVGSVGAHKTVIVTLGYRGT